LVALRHCADLGWHFHHPQQSRIHDPTHRRFVVDHPALQCDADALQLRLHQLGPQCRRSQRLQQKLPVLFLDRDVDLVFHGSPCILN
jgi:hypothetical protein